MNARQAMQGHGSGLSPRSRADAAALRVRKLRFWSDDELLLCSEMGRDGFTALSIAKRLGRGEKAVGKQLNLMGISLLRGPTKPLGLKIKQDAFVTLQEGAKARAMTTSSFTRLVLELLVGQPAFLAQLLDDDLRAERHDALELTEDPRPKAISPSASPVAAKAPGPSDVPSPSAPAQPMFSAIMSRSPELMARSN
jgi:hypothetical protein